MLRFLTLIVSVFFVTLAGIGMLPTVKIDGLLFGLFTATFFNNLLNLAIGLIGLVCFLKGTAASKWFFFVAGTFFALLGLAGIYYGPRTFFSLITVATPDSIFHLCIGLVFLYIGFIFIKR